ncbi:MAG: hypothetical protein JJ900_08090 [Rhodospirillales bacterium]|nr:hypothetical protein [Rhodospirillales bacterium]MBO6786797.1 hypothetical protein [Rhodospirillales bacterium]
MLNYAKLIDSKFENGSDGKLLFFPNGALRGKGYEIDSEKTATNLRKTYGWTYVFLILPMMLAVSGKYWEIGYLILIPAFLLAGLIGIAHRIVIKQLTRNLTIVYNEVSEREFKNKTATLFGWRTLIFTELFMLLLIGGGIWLYFVAPDKREELLFIVPFLFLVNLAVVSLIVRKYRTSNKQQNAVAD